MVLRRKWLDEDRFLEAMTVGRSLPGPNVSNLAAFIGALLGGYRGAVAAVLGIVAPGVGLVLLLAASYGPLAATPGPLLRGGLQGLTAGVVGVMASTVVQALKPVARARAGLVFAVAAFVAAAILRLSMMVVLVMLVPLASLLNRDEAP